jgi:hypothetical protein
MAPTNCGWAQVSTGRSISSAVICDQVGVVRDHAAGHHHLLAQRVHLEHALDHRVVDALDDVGHRAAGADALEHLGGREHGAVAAQLDHVVAWRA